MKERDKRQGRGMEVLAEVGKLKQDKIDIARKLKAMNIMTAEQIAATTGLTVEVIRTL